MFIKSILKSKKSGVTLIELLATLMILSVSVLPLTSLLNQTLKNSADAKVTATLIYTAQFAMESMLSVDLAELRVGSYWYAYKVPLSPSSTNYLYKFKYSAEVEVINPAYSGDLADTGANITRPIGTGMDGYGIKGNFYRIHVIAENDLMPSKKLELWTIVTPAGKGY